MACHGPPDENGNVLEFYCCPCYENPGRCSTYGWGPF
jgi:hypothetical protein